MKAKTHREEIRRVALLAKIKLRDREEKEYAAQLKTILEYFSTMDKLKVRELSPWAYLQIKTDAVRHDEPRVDHPDALLKLVPRRKGRFIKAPKM